jgi:hypothetical protein
MSEAATSRSPIRVVSLALTCAALGFAAAWLLQPRYALAGGGSGGAYRLDVRTGEVCVFDEDPGYLANLGCARDPEESSDSSGSVARARRS